MSRFPSSFFSLSRQLFPRHFAVGKKEKETLFFYVLYQLEKLDVGMDDMLEDDALPQEEKPDVEDMLVEFPKWPGA